MNKIKYFYMNTAEILDTALDIYKKTFGKQLALAIIFNIFFLAAAFAVAAGGVFVFAAAALNPFKISTLGTEMITSITVFVSVICGILVLKQAVYSGGSILLTKKAFMGENCSLDEILKAGLKKAPALISVGIAQLIVLIPFIFVAAGLAALYVVYFYYAIVRGFFSVAIFIAATVVLVISLLIITVAASAFIIASYPAAVFEGKYFFSAIMRGIDLICLDYRKIIGVVAVYNIVSMMISYSFSAFSGLGKYLMSMFLPRNVASYMTIASVSLDYLFSAFLAMVLTPLPVIFSTIIYINQRIKNEGFDIELKLMALKKPSQGGSNGL